jgi:tricorn protease
MAQSVGYYRMATIRGDLVSFISEDDLWLLELEDGKAAGPARRLSANPGKPRFPSISPDGKWIAYTGEDEGQFEVYVMPVAGGPARRVTYLSANTNVLGWDPNEPKMILFASDAGQGFMGLYRPHCVHMDGGEPCAYPHGPAPQIALQPGGKGVVLLRNGGGRRACDPAMWKRYKGGTAGELWIDRTGSGKFKKLIELNGDIAAPMWIGDRVYFLADHEGWGNIYSCTPTGQGLKRHSDHDDFYVRHPRTDGERIVYTCGADIYLLDPAVDHPVRLDAETPSTRPQRSRRFVPAGRFLESYDVHPKGHAMCVTARGKPFTFAHWEEAVMQRGEPDGAVRYRLARWLPGSDDIVAISDRGGAEHIVILRASGTAKHLEHDRSLGRAVTMAVAPAGDGRVAIGNNQYEALIVDLKTGAVTEVDRSRYDRIEHLAWSPDGRYLAYGRPSTETSAQMMVRDTKTGTNHAVSVPDFQDFAPSFDPEGKYLYFLSCREFNPVYDTYYFDLGFPRGTRVIALPLKADLASPFEAKPLAPGAGPNAGGDGAGKKGDKPEPIEIDFDGITDRAVACPVPEGRYGQLAAIAGKLLFTSGPIPGSRDEPMMNGGASAKLSIDVYDLAKQKHETLIPGVTSFTVSMDRKVLAYRSAGRLRVLAAGEKPPSPNGPTPAGNGPGRQSGWLDLGRLRICIDPAKEWRQMFDEAWRLQRAQFWTEDMSGVDWDAMHDRYGPLLERVASRAEFSDLLWELQGELGTSHAYEYGGDYRPTPQYGQGFLGADYAYDSEAKAWRIEAIVRGDAWDRKVASPLAAPGVGVSEGDRIIAINQRKLTATQGPREHLVHTANQHVVLTVADANGKRKRDVTVQTIGQEFDLRYRAWVESNRKYVHETSRGRIGYVHVPDMGPRGFAEFHRQYLVESQRPALIVDVRYNGGGHVSQLILEKLMRKRIGYDLQRWGDPWSYPSHAMLGPIVGLTNQFAGSDGDIFSHCFKLFRIGPLIGKRTWGGVIGIYPRHQLVDGTTTSQPEFSFWFEDVGFAVENYGTDPDIDLDIAPQDYAADRDTQLDRGIKEAQALMKKTPAKLPSFGRKPQTKAPKLPKRPT